MAEPAYAREVFINCPFDPEYQNLFNAIVFAVFDCGYRARCAKEIDDSSEVRIDAITRIIASCKFGIHDLSRTELDKESGLPRFNMPLELGMFLAAKRLGGRRQREKVCLILDRSQYRYQRFVSDIAGQDIRSHRNSPRIAIRMVRDWLSTASGRVNIPGGAAIHGRYRLFRRDLPKVCARFQLTPQELTFNDHADMISRWLEETAA